MRLQMLSVLGVLAFLGGCAASQFEASIPKDVPRTAGSLASGNQQFRFAVIGDRTGAHRPGVFADAVAKLELLKPDFVISVGDLIEGYTSDEAEILRQWEEVEGHLSDLSMPTFFIAGNHDYSNATMARIWKERRGAPYWSFAYRGVLFIGISTEDPPYEASEKTLASTQQLEKAMAADPARTQQRLLEAVRERGTPPKLPGAVNISEEQVAFVRKALADHQGARWTFLIMHKPAWQYSNEAFERIEEMLAGRSYTVIAGHEHYYGRENRLGRDYIVMGTTGGVWLRDGPGRVDHVAMITMTENGPSIANILVDGIFPKEGQPTSIPEGVDASSGQ